MERGAEVTKKSLMERRATVTKKTSMESRAETGRERETILLQLSNQIRNGSNEDLTHYKSLQELGTPSSNDEDDILEQGQTDSMHEYTEDDSTTNLEDLMRREGAFSKEDSDNSRYSYNAQRLSSRTDKGVAAIEILCTIRGAVGGLGRGRRGQQGRRGQRGKGIANCEEDAYEDQGSNSGWDKSWRAMTSSCRREHVEASHDQRQLGTTAHGRGKINQSELQPGTITANTRII